MSFRYGMLALLGAGLSVSSPARAQVLADIHVGPGPVEGRVIVGAPHVVVREPVLVRRPVTYLLPVERLNHRHPKWYHRKGWRPVTVWFDGRRFSPSGVDVAAVLPRSGRARARWPLWHQRPDRGSEL
jgi:hypothetical protein